MTETATVTILVDNAPADPPLVVEHGLALWIEAGGSRVLFDTGQGTALGPNAEALGVPLDRADAVILSHGHYDHTGGLPTVLAGAAPALPVFAHRGILDVRFSIAAEAGPREIGIPTAGRDALDRRGHLVPTHAPTRVRGPLHVTGPIPHETDFEDTGGPFFTDSEGQHPDALDDDQAAWFDSAYGLVVLLGCAHAGVVNTLRHVRRLADGRPIHAVIGGMHLHAASEERIEATIAELRALDLRLLVPLHCTGHAAAIRLEEAFPDAFQAGKAGSVFTFPLPPRPTFDPAPGEPSR